MPVGCCPRRSIRSSSAASGNKARGPEEVKLRSSSDVIGKRRLGYREDPDPLFLTYGPKNRREFLNLLSWKGGKLGD